MAFRRAKARARKPALQIETVHRSGLEKRIAAQLDAAGVPYVYEGEKLEYEVPARTAKYLPDFKLANGIYVEAKGWFQAKDRQKMVLVKAAHPDKDIRMVFQRAANKIYTGSKTTCAQWATDHGFQYADHGVIPDSWLKEKPRKT